MKAPALCSPLLKGLVPAVLCVCVGGCTRGDSVAPPQVAPKATLSSSETTGFTPAGPQSFTPETRSKGAGRTVRRLWSSTIGRTDHRTTLVFADGAIYVGAKSGKGVEAGVYVVDGNTGARRAVLPAAKGDVVGIALDGARVVSSGSSGEVAVTTKTGQIVFRTQIGAPIVTPPTLLDLDRDGAAEIAVGDARGRVTLLDGKSGKIRWVRATAPEAREGAKGAASIGAALSAADLDGDGDKEIVAGNEAGSLTAIRAKSGEIAWQVTRPSALRAAPLVSDVDDDRQLEVIAGWADGDVAIFDGRAGKQVWTARVEEDDGDPTGLLASPTPLPGGSLLVPTARWGDQDSVVVLRAKERAYRSKQGAVVSSPVLGIIARDTSMVEAVLGTSTGDVVSFDAAGGMALLQHVDGAIEASPLIADIQGNGLQELVVVTREGELTALGIHAHRPPLVSRGRGSSPWNDGVLPPIDLGWKLP
ncbi:MAG: PQQ-binding-like beta-propeller repeat protein [Deltaproteobacteria bacterium]|nr:PQQ-binding-like beta-propeller repeat protein [Deltaproteobacteria bacterium]